jgi:hypothetical protein
MHYTWLHTESWPSATHLSATNWSPHFLCAIRYVIKSERSSSSRINVWPPSPILKLIYQQMSQGNSATWNYEWSPITNMRNADMIFTKQLAVCGINDRNYHWSWITVYCWIITHTLKGNQHWWIWINGCIRYQMHGAPFYISCWRPCQIWFSSLFMYLYQYIICMDDYDVSWKSPNYPMNLNVYSYKYANDICRCSLRKKTEYYF